MKTTEMQLEAEIYDNFFEANNAFFELTGQRATNDVGTAERECVIIDNVVFYVNAPDSVYVIIVLEMDSNVLRQDIQREILTALQRALMEVAIRAQTQETD